MAESRKSRQTEVYNGQVNFGRGVRPIDRQRTVSVGPLLRTKVTGKSCFLTVRHVFGSLATQENRIIGSKLIHVPKPEENLPEVTHSCGEVVADEFSENVDAALVEINREFVPTGPRIKTEQLIKSGIKAPRFSEIEIAGVIDARKLRPEDVKERQLQIIKIGFSTGVTVGQLILQHNGAYISDNTIKSHQHELRRIKIITLKQQLLVHSVSDDKFASDGDEGAAVFAVDKDCRLFYIGMICRLISIGKTVVVTPIQTILECFENKLGETLELDLSENKVDDSDFDLREAELFQQALREGEENDRHLRVNIVGFYAEGKTTLTRRLLNRDLKGIESTDGIDVHIRECKMTPSEWISCEDTDAQKGCLGRLVNIAKAELEKSSNTADQTTSKVQAEAMMELKECSLTDNSTTEDTCLPSYGSGQEESGCSNVPSADTANVKNESLMRQFSDHFRSSETTLPPDELMATFWDFGGQFIYYATHQIFHSRDAIYLLVFDLTKDLESILVDYDFQDRKDKMKNSLLFWLNSIHAFVGTEDGLQPTVILVGTHRDKFQGDVDAKFEEIIDLFAGTKARNHIYGKTFAIAAVDEGDQKVDELRKTIYEIGLKNSSNKKLPAKWIPLEMALLQIRQKNIVTFEEMKQLDAELDQPIKETGQLKLFLKYHHAKGTLVYFDEKLLKEYIVVNPSYLIDAFRCIITSKSFCKWNVKLQPLWDKLFETAVLENDLLTEVWKKDGEKDFFENSSILLKFLERHRILSELKETDESTKELVGLNMYMIPSLLKRNCQEEVWRSFLRGKQCTRAILGFDLEHEEILNIIYERIIAAALGRWPPIGFKDQYLVFQNVGFFKLNFQHAGQIAVKERKGIELSVVSQCPPSEVEATVCFHFREFVELVITHEFGKLHSDERNKPFKIYYKCNHPDHSGTGSRRSYDLESLSAQAKVSCPDNESHPVSVTKANAEWFCEDISPETDSENSDLTEKELSRIAQAIGNNWELLGLELGLSSVDIEHIKSQHRDSGTPVVIFYMLREWRKRKPEKCKRRDLMRAIKSCKCLSFDLDKLS